MTTDQLSSALNASQPPDNLVPDLTFLLAQVLEHGTVEQCYLPDGINLIRAAAAAKPSEVKAAESKLKAHFQKDFNIPRFRTSIKEAKADLTVPVDSPLLVSESGAIKPILANAITKLADSPVKVAFDIFSDVVTIMEPSPWGTNGRWRDQDDGECTNYLQHADVVVASPTAHEAVYVVACRKKFHPVKDYLNWAESQWDGQERLKHLMGYYFGAFKNGCYEAEVSRMWGISLIARIFQPGCQCKYMVVLEGEQDDGKSRAIRALANGHNEGMGGTQWFRDRTPRLDRASSQEIGQFLQGVWIIEIAELAAFGRSEQDDLKSFISTQTDTFRSPYGRNMQEYPRQCVFAATVNVNKDSTPDWGKDPTGLVRFWPVRVGKPIVSAAEGPSLIRDRTQILGEAVSLYKAGSLWYPEPGDDSFNRLARAEQDERMAEDDLAPVIIEIANKLAIDMWVATCAVVAELNLPPSQMQGNRASGRVGTVLRKDGWRKKQERFKGRQEWGWVRGE